MLTQITGRTADRCTPDRATAFGIFGVVLCAAGMAVLEWRAGDADATPSVLILVGGSTWAFLVLMWACARVKHRKTLAALLGPISTAALLLILTWGIVYPSYRSRNEGTALVQEITGFSAALCRYASDHGGSFPRALTDLIDGAYIRRTKEGTWVVPGEGVAPRTILRNPEWFDVAWGANAEQLNQEGIVTSRSRRIVCPASLAQNVRGLDAACTTISQLVGERLGKGAPDGETTQ